MTPVPSVLVQLCQRAIGIFFRMWSQVVMNFDGQIDISTKNLLDFQHACISSIWWIGLYTPLRTLHYSLSSPVHHSIFTVIHRRSLSPWLPWSRSWALSSHVSCLRSHLLQSYECTRRGPADQTVPVQSPSLHLLCRPLSHHTPHRYPSFTWLLEQAPSRHSMYYSTTFLMS